VDVKAKANGPRRGAGTKLELFRDLAARPAPGNVAFPLADYRSV